VPCDQETITYLEHAFGLEPHRPLNRKHHNCGEWLLMRWAPSREQQAELARLSLGQLAQRRRRAVTLDPANTVAEAVEALETTILAGLNPA
jgi:hypothetical protein